MKCYVDLDGKIPAKVGDRVARMDCGEYVFVQKSEAMRPSYVEIDGICGITDVTGYGITVVGECEGYLEGEIK